MRNIYYYSKINTLMSANSLLYSISKFPLFKGLEVTTLYINEKLKNAIGIIGFVLEIFKSFVGSSALVYLLIVYIPDLLTSSKSFGYSLSPEIRQSLFIILFCLAPSLMQSIVFHNPEKDYPFLSFFQIDPKTFYLLKIVQYFFRSILFVPILFYIFHEPITVVMLVMFDIATALLSNSFFLKYYDEKGNLPNHNARYLLAFVFAVATYVGLLFGKLPGLPNDRQLHLLIILSLTSIGVGCWFYAIRYKKYNNIATQYANKHVAALHISISTTLNEDDIGLRNSESDENETYLDKFESLSPQHYIERAFLHRFKKPIIGFIKNKILWNLAICVMLGLIIRWGFISIDNSKILNYSPILLSLVLSMTYGRAYFQLCFRNTDLPLLHLQLYSKSTIQKSIWMRLAVILVCGSIMLAFFGLSLLVLIRLGGIPISMRDLSNLMGIYALVFLIYEIYNTITYYLFQPYSTELTIKHPAYTVLSIAEILFGILVLFSRSNVIELIKPLGVTLLLLTIGLILLTMKVDTTFKLRL